MKFLYAALIGVVLMSCGEPQYQEPLPLPVDSLPLPINPPDSLGPGKSDDPHGKGKKAELAQVCQSSLMVNGEAAVPGARSIEVDRIPSQLNVELVDCPHPTALVRGNFVRTGAGSGELHVSVVKRGSIQRFDRLGSTRVVLGGERPGSGAYRTDSSPALIKWITRPGGYALPEGVATTPAEVSSVITARTQKGVPGDNYRVEVKFNQFDSEGNDRALLFREKCSPEAQASPSRFDC